MARNGQCKDCYYNKKQTSKGEVKCYIDNEWPDGDTTCPIDEFKQA